MPRLKASPAERGHAQGEGTIQKSSKNIGQPWFLIGFSPLVNASLDNPGYLFDNVWHILIPGHATQFFSCRHTPNISQPHQGQWIWAAAWGPPRHKAHLAPANSYYYDQFQSKGPQRLEMVGQPDQWPGSYRQQGQHALSRKKSEKHEHWCTKCTKCIINKLDLGRFVDSFWFRSDTTWSATCPTQVWHVHVSTKMQKQTPLQSLPRRLLAKWLLPLGVAFGIIWYHLGIWG